VGQHGICLFDDAVWFGGLGSEGLYLVELVVGEQLLLDHPDELAGGIRILRDGIPVRMSHNRTALRQADELQDTGQ
jgi:hypothetical protein